MNHYDEEQLSQYLSDRRSFENARALEEHLQQCDECISRLKFVEMIERGLRDELPWLIVAELEAPTTAPDGLLRAADEMERDRMAARALLAPLLSSPVSFGRAQIERDPRFATVGVVEVLTRSAEAVREDQPKFALQLANAAIAIATRLAHEGKLTSHCALGAAWTERMVALGMLGRFQDAERAGQNAEKAFDRDPHSTPHDSAIVWLNRSVICVETGRVTEAQVLAAAAARQFIEFGDQTRYLKARLASGNVLFMQERYGDALIDLEEVVALARRQDDRILLSRSLQSLGETYAALKDFDKAMSCLADNFAIADEIGSESEKMRAIWSIGNVLMHTGKLPEAMRRFEEARQGFEALGAMNDAGLVRLQLAEAMLAAGRPHDVPHILEGIAMSFAAEGMVRNANLALAYLREAVNGGTADVRLLRDVRAYLEHCPLNQRVRSLPRTDFSSDL